MRFLAAPVQRDDVVLRHTRLAHGALPLVVDLEPLLVRVHAFVLVFVRVHMIMQPYRTHAHLASWRACSSCKFA